MDPNIFFPDIDAPKPERVRQADVAKRICAGCPVRSECLEAHRHERFGVFGGMDANERLGQSTPTNMKACGICSEFYEVRGSNQLYCGPTCKSIARTRSLQKSNAKVSANMGSARENYNRKRRKAREAARQTAGSSK
jgi:hypothetical protein